MSFDARTLSELLPVIYRLRDAEQGEPLKALLSALAEQIAVLEENLEQLWDDQFIETCADWVAPYLGDLVGYRPLHGVVPGVASPRAEVANTIAYRRRKGTAAVLEQLARDVTGWPARAVELFQLLGWTQHMNHIRPQHSYAPDLRRWLPLQRRDSAFDSLAHSVEVRRIGGGVVRHNIPNVALFLWRLEAFPLTASPAVQVDSRRFRCSPLGNDVPLFSFPETEQEITHLAEPRNVPEPIGRRLLDAFKEDYYGPGRSLLLTLDGTEIPSSDICACDLSDAGGGSWAHQPQDRIAIDPELGRIAFPESLPPPLETVAVSFHTGFSAAMGGGEYERSAAFDTLLEPYAQVTAPATIQAALSSDGGVVEITHSGRFEESLSVQLDAGRRLELRAANRCRPALILGADLDIVGGSDSELTLDGLLISGARLRVPIAATQLRRLRLRHCTLVPGLALAPDGEPLFADEPSLIVELPGVELELDHCIVGGLRVCGGSKVRITESIVDATTPTGVAFAAPDHESAGGELYLTSSTVIGKVHTRLLQLASCCIFHAALAEPDTWPTPLRSELRQRGCVRFSFLPEGSRVPRRHRCQPDLAIRQAITEAERRTPGLSDQQRAAIADGVRSRIRPVFTDLRYGRPAYCQLHAACPEEIRTGSDDESEMGAFHRLYAPQRETNLRVRLDEYLRFGLEAGAVYAT